MINEKKYYSISEVSRILQIKEHVIRHWDSIDPKTNKIRIENLSIRTNGGTRFFNRSHIKKLSLLKKLLIENGKRNYSLNLASKILDQNKLKIKDINYSETNFIESEKSKMANHNYYVKIKKVINNLNKLL